MPARRALHNLDAVSFTLIRSLILKPRTCPQLLYPPWRTRALCYANQRRNWSRFESLDRLEQEQTRSPAGSENSLHEQSQNNGQWPNDQEPPSTATYARQGGVASPEERAHIDASDSSKDAHTRSHNNEAILLALLKQLQQAAVKKPDAKATNKHLRKIILEEHVRPEVSHYEALVLSNCDSKNGSIDMIEAVLQEMEEQKIEVGSAIYIACLKVLAVHPDYLKRTAILGNIRSQWLASTPVVDHLLVAGYVKDGQLELAMQTLEGMRLRKVRIEQWVWTLMLYSLCAAEDFDAVMKLIYQLDDDKIEMTADALDHILERASQHSERELTKWIWHRMVEPRHVKPTRKASDNVLLIAAQAEDKRLQGSVSNVLTEVHDRRGGRPPRKILLQDKHSIATKEEGQNGT